MLKVLLQKGKEKKVKNFYPNIFKDDIKSIIGQFKTGEIADVCDNEGAFVGRGYVTEGTSAEVRILTVVDEKINKDFFINKIKIAYERRKHLYDETNSFRSFYSEGDGIPGLILDEFDRYNVIQFRNSGVEIFRDEILAAIKKIIKPKGIYERSDVESRVHEGVEKKSGILYGEIPDRIIMKDNGIKYAIDIKNGQKTGFFLDQRDSRKFIQKYITKDVRFLDVFSSSGGFSMRALVSGAKEAVAIDKDSHAIELCHENYELNELDSNFFAMEGDAALIMDTLISRKEKYNIITLDPPTLVKKKSEINKGRDLFYDLCDKGFQLLAKNGIMGIMSCAYHITLQDLLEVTRMAASKNKKLLQVIGINYQPEDHPWILHVPETLYLKALWVRSV